MQDFLGAKKHQGIHGCFDWQEENRVQPKVQEVNQSFDLQEKFQAEK